MNFLSELSTSAGGPPPPGPVLLSGLPDLPPPGPPLAPPGPGGPPSPYAAAAALCRDGQRARAAGSPEQARAAFLAGMESLPRSAWVDKPALAGSLLLGAAECAQLLSASEEALGLAEAVLDRTGGHPPGPVAVRALAVKLRALASLDRPSEAIGLLRDAGARFGPRFSSALALIGSAGRPASTGGPAAVSAMLDRLGRGCASLHGLAPARTREARAFQRLLLAAVPAALRLKPAILSGLTLAILDNSLAAGLTPASPFGLLLLGHLQAVLLGRRAEGFRTAAAAFRLARPFGSGSVRAGLCHLFGALAAHWRLPAEASRAFLARSRRAALGSRSLTGRPDLREGSLLQLRTGLFLGERLDVVEERAMMHLGMGPPDRTRVLFIAGLRLARGLRETRPVPDGPGSLAPDWLQACGSPATLAGYLLNFLQAAVLDGRYADARSLADELDGVLPALAGTLDEAEAVFYACLAAAASRDREPPAGLEARLALLGAWAADAPRNFESRHLLARAEACRSRGDKAAAMRGYDAALRAAAAAGFDHIEGLAGELAARFHGDEGFPLIAEAYGRVAVEAYARWGAAAKAEALAASLGLAGPARSRPGAGLDSPGELHRLNRVLRSEMTGRLQAEVECRRLASVVEQASDSIALADGRLILSYVNRSFERLHGVSRQEAVGAETSRFFDAPDGPDLFGAMAAALGRSETWEGRLDVRRPDGTILHKKTSAFPVRPGAGEPVSFCFVERDVATEARLQKQLHHSKKMEALGTLAGSIAHDFNNMLGGIMACVEMAQDTLAEDSEAGFELGEALKACGYAKDMIRQILTFSRRGEAAKSPLAMAPLVREGLHLACSGAPRTIEARCSIQAERDVVLGDPGRISQVVMNLCTNAVQAMLPDGGVLTVSLSDVVLTDAETRLHPGLPAGPYLRLTVADTGHGMDSEIMERIFDPFFTTKAKGGGVGLGLSVVHGIVAELGGQITVESEPGRGSTFSVLLPRAVQRAAPPAAGTAAPPKGAERILFVEDEDLLASALTRQLEGFGYTVVRCADGLEALAAFTACPDGFDLVMTDLTMPGMTGTELARRIRDTRPDIPVLLCTGYADMLRPEEAAELGVTRILAKPFVKAEVATLVRHVLDRK